ncbi:MAG: SCP2 sterol-binding domain-containing protein [Porticoccus sp.]|nr:SCP2 sterol-binding domain-containing protein [Porticoccus sp.]
MIFDFLSNNPLKTVQTSALMAVEAAVNKALEYDPATQNAIGKLAGKVLAVECTLPPMTFYVIHSDTDISLMGQYEGEPDTTLRGSSLSLASLATDGQDRVSFFDTGVEVRGDHDLLRQIKKILKNLDVDWEAAMSQLIGDVPAHLIGESLRSSMQWKKDVVKRATAAAAEFSQEEVRLTPSRNEVDHFNNEVKHINNDVDRLAARINKLKVNLDQQDSHLKKTHLKNGDS